VNNHSSPSKTGPNAAEEEALFLLYQVHSDIPYIPHQTHFYKIPISGLYYWKYVYIALPPTPTLYLY